MGTIFADDFNAYTDGGLAGQGGWVVVNGYGDFVVEGTVAREGAKAIVSGGIGSGLRYVKKIGTPLDLGNIAFYGRIGSIPVINSCFAGLGGPTGCHLAISIYSDGIIRAGIHQTDPALGSVVVDTWYLFEIQWWIESGYYVAKFRMNGGDWSTTVGADWAIGYDAPLEGFYIGTWQSDFYVDYIAENPLPIPAPPTSLVATPGVSSIGLAWDAMVGATSYNVYRSYHSGIGYSLIGSSLTNSYTDSTPTKGEKYFYVVTSVNIYGESAYSSEANGLIPPDTFWTQVAIQSGSVNGIYSLCVFNGNLYGCGANGYLLRWDGVSAWVVVAPQIGPHSINALCVYDDGSGSTVYGINDHGDLWKWNGTNAWTQVAARLLPASIGYSLCVYDDGGGNRLYAGVQAGRLYRWDNVGDWETMAYTPAGESYIPSICVFDDGGGIKLYGAGGITGKLYKWDGASLWIQVAGALGTEKPICLCVFNGDLYAGTQGSANLYKWDKVSSWILVAPQFGTEYQIKSLSVFNGNLYGGSSNGGLLIQYDSVNGVWIEAAVELNSQFRIDSLAVFNSKLYGGTEDGGRLFKWSGGPLGWSHKWMGIYPSKIMGIPVADVKKFMGIA